MPLLTVVSVDRKTKVLVFQDSVQGIIHAAIKKLGLPIGEYRIVLADKNVAVDEDDLVPHLPKSTELMILSKNQQWSKGSIQTPPNVNTVQNEDSEEIEDATMPNDSSSERLPPLAVPWSRLPESMKVSWESRKRISPSERRDLIKIIGLYMRDRNDYTSSTCRKLTDEIISKYPDTFADHDADGQIIGDGRNSFALSLYDHILYKKPSTEKKNKRLRQSNDANTLQPDTPSRIHNKSDEYGCVAYEPPLPEGETLDSQEKKRISILDELDTNENAEEGMNLTYPSQRADINHRPIKGLSIVLERWPLMRSPKYFFQHASSLLGKDVINTWETNVAEKGNLIYSIINQEYQKKKSSKGDVFSNKIKDILLKSDEASKNLRSSAPLFSAVFLLLMQYFKEKEDIIFCHANDTITVAEIKDQFNTIRPLLLLQGTSLYDEKILFRIVCEGEVLIESKGMKEGFLALFLSYYIYGYTYPEECQRTLEFIQRVFLKINPNIGHKRGGKAKRKKLVVDPQVHKLMKKILATVHDENLNPE